MSEGRKGKKRALIIGISRYKQLENLDFCENDGRAMYDVLNNKLGYEVLDDHFLIRETNYDRMRRAISNFFTDKTTSPEDTLLFYFSGHGVPEINGNHYLATSDIDRNAPYEEGYSFRDLTEMMPRSISKRIVATVERLVCQTFKAWVMKKQMLQEHI